MPEQRDLLFVEDVTERLGVSVTTLWRMRRDGRFPPPTHWVGRKPAWTRRAYEAFLYGDAVAAGELHHGA